METENNPTYKILNAYRKKDGDKLAVGIGGTGLVALIAGAVIDSTPLSIGGATCVGLATAGEGLEYMRAYFEARLDYLKNNKFTRLEE